LLDRLHGRVFVWAEPRRSLEDVFDVRVGMLGPAHECDGGDQRPVAVRTNDLLCAEPVLDGHHQRAAEMPFEPSGDGSTVRSIASDDDEIDIRKIGRLGGGRDPHTRIARLRRHVQMGLVQRPRMCLATNENVDLTLGGQVAREQTPDRAGTGDADPLDQTTAAPNTSPSFRSRYPRYGPGSIGPPAARSTVSCGVNFRPYRCTWSRT